MINIQNTGDNECFKLYLVRYLHRADHHPARIRKVDKGYARQLDFKDKKFSFKITDTHKIEKKNWIVISVFVYENKQKYPTYVSKNTFWFIIDRRRKNALCSYQRF